MCPEVCAFEGHFVASKVKEVAGEFVAEVSVPLTFAPSKTVIAEQRRHLINEDDTLNMTIWALDWSCEIWRQARVCGPGQLVCLLTRSGPKNLKKKKGGRKKPPRHILNHRFERLCLELRNQSVRLGTFVISIDQNIVAPNHQAQPNHYLCEASKVMTTKSRRLGIRTLAKLRTRTRMETRLRMKTQTTSRTTT